MDDQEEPKPKGPRLTGSILKAKVFRHPDTGKRIEIEKGTMDQWLKTTKS